SLPRQLCRPGFSIALRTLVPTENYAHSASPYPPKDTRYTTANGTITARRLAASTTFTPCPVTPARAPLAVSVTGCASVEVLAPAVGEYSGARPRLRSASAVAGRGMCPLLVPDRGGTAASGKTTRPRPVRFRARLRAEPAVPAQNRPGQTSG